MLCRGGERGLWASAVDRKITIRTILIRLERSLVDYHIQLNQDVTTLSRALSL